MTFLQKTVDKFSHNSSYHNIFSDIHYNFVDTQAVYILNQGPHADIKAMVGPDFHYFNQGSGLKLCTMSDKDFLNNEGKIRKK